MHLRNKEAEPDEINKCKFTALSHFLTLDRPHVNKWLFVQGIKRKTGTRNRTPRLNDATNIPAVNHTPLRTGQ